VYAIKKKHINYFSFEKKYNLWKILFFLFFVGISSWKRTINKTFWFFHLKESEGPLSITKTTLLIFFNGFLMTIVSILYISASVFRVFFSREAFFDKKRSKIWISFDLEHSVMNPNPKKLDFQSEGLFRVPWISFSMF